MTWLTIPNIGVGLLQGPIFWAYTSHSGMAKRLRWCCISMNWWMLIGHFEKLFVLFVLIQSYSPVKCFGPSPINIKVSTVFESINNASNHRTVLFVDHINCWSLTWTPKKLDLEDHFPIGIGMIFFCPCQMASSFASEHCQNWGIRYHGIMVLHSFSLDHHRYHTIPYMALWCFMDNLQQSFTKKSPPWNVGPFADDSP